MKRTVLSVLLIGLMLLCAACGSKTESGSLKSEEYNNYTAAPQSTQVSESSEHTESAQTEIEPIGESLEEPEIDLGEGPIFMSGDLTGFTLTLYSLSTGKETVIFTFNNPSNEYRLAINLDKQSTHRERRAYVREQLFDSKIERIAVSKNGHVGWVDKNGVFTDVTDIVHPVESTGFASRAPQDSLALFTSDDKFFFYDGLESQYCYYDPQSKSITSTIKKEDYRYPADGLDFDDKPTYFSSPSGTDLLANFNSDYIIDNGEIVRITIYHYGMDWVTANGEKITPDTDYRLNGELATSGNTIVFLGEKSNGLELFSMTYTNGEASMPEIIATIDKSLGKIIFWK